jgi:hypothetical protein
MVMFRAHPLLGLIKGFYKGTIPALFLDLFWRYSEAILGFALGWLGFELLLLLGRLLSGPVARPPTPEAFEPVS